LNREHVAVGDLVGIADSRLGSGGDQVVRRDPQELAVVVVCVRRGSLGVEPLAAGPLVDRGVSLRLERLRVVAGRDQQVAVGIELERAGGVAAVLAQVGPLEDRLLGGQVEVAALVKLEPGDALGVRFEWEGRVGEVDPAARLEVGSEGDPHQPVLGEHRDRNHADLARALRLGVPDPDDAAALGVEDAAVGGDLDLHRVEGVRLTLGLVAHELGLLELGRLPLGGARHRGPHEERRRNAERRNLHTTRPARPPPCAYRPRP
jgi:hypothetical protein